MGIFNVGHPITKRLIDGILQSLGARIYPSDLTAEQTHAIDIRLLTAHIFNAHVNDALETQQSTGGCGRHPMLTSACFGNDALLTQALSNQSLANRIVDFVGTGVIEVFALKPNTTLKTGTQPCSKAQWRRTTDIGLQQVVELGEKFFILASTLDALHAIGRAPELMFPTRNDLQMSQIDRLVAESPTSP